MDTTKPLAEVGSSEGLGGLAQAAAEGRDAYQRGWDDCMTLWADHMKRMNEALTKPLPEGWANHAHHIYRNVCEALEAAPIDARGPNAKLTGEAGGETK